MGVNHIGVRRTRKLARETGLDINHISVWSHGAYWIWEIVDQLGGVWRYDTRTTAFALSHNDPRRIWPNGGILHQ